MLNHDLFFDKLPYSVQNSFNGRIARREVIPAGTFLYKFTDWDFFNPKLDKDKNEVKDEDGNTIYQASAFWGTMGDLADILAYAERTHKTLLDCVRERNAVLHNWNGLTSMIIFKITKSVIGFTGNIGPQSERGYAKESHLYTRHYTAPVYFNGGASQVYLPNLERQHITETVPPNTVLITDDVGAIKEFIRDCIK